MSSSEVFHSSNELLDAARHMIETAIRPEPASDQLLVVFDQFGFDVATAVCEAAARLLQPCTALYVPFSTQQAMPVLRALGRIRDMVAVSDVLITALTDSHDSTAFRVELVTRAKNRGLKTVHMPGVDAEIFLAGVTGVDFDNLHLAAEELAAELTSSNHAVVRTMSHETGEEHVLSLRLHGRAGHADAGIAARGEVINIPTGEAFVAPLESSADGSVVIAGSFPEIRLGKSREVTLVFKQGRLNLAGSNFNHRGNGTAFQCQQILERAEQDAPGALCIGELGIGLNRLVAGVDGRTILDEKVFGTAHIAIGANKAFGGDLSGPYHHDLVFYPTAIELDGRAVAIPWKRPLED